jgi:hypothetical protein
MMFSGCFTKGTSLSSGRRSWSLPSIHALNMPSAIEAPDTWSTRRRDTADIASPAAIGSLPAGNSRPRDSTRDASPSLCSSERQCVGAPFFWAPRAAYGSLFIARSFQRWQPLQPAEATVIG